MAILKNARKALQEERRKNEALEAQLAKEREKIQFLGLLAADIDIDELMNDEEDGADNGEG